MIPVLALLARLGLAAVFAISGAAKAVDPTGTRIAVRAYQLMPTGLADTVAAVLPYLELALALLLVLGLATRLAGVFGAILLVVFIAGVISAAARGLSIDCGCFGGGGQVASGQTAYTAEILRDVGFLVLAVVVIVWPRSRWSLDYWLARRLDHGGSTGADHQADLNV